MRKTSLHFLFDGSFWIHIYVGFHATLVLLVCLVEVSYLIFYRLVKGKCFEQLSEVYMFFSSALISAPYNV